MSVCEGLHRAVHTEICSCIQDRPALPQLSPSPRIWVCALFCHCCDIWPCCPGPALCRGGP